MISYEKKSLYNKKDMREAVRPVRLWLLVSFLLTVFVAAVVLNPAANDIINAGSEVQRLVRAGTGYRLAASDQADIFPLGSFQVRHEQGGLLYLDGKGREQAWHETNLLSAQVICSADDHLIIGDKESSKFVIAQEAGVRFSDKVTSRVVGADLSGDDLVILDQGQDNKGEIRYYDLGRKELMFTLKYQDSGYPLLVRIVPGEEAIDILVLNTDKVDPFSLIQRYGLDGKLQSEVRLTGYYGSFVHNGKLVIAYSDTNIAEIDMETEELNSFTLPSGFSYIVTDRTGVIMFGDVAGEDQSWIMRFNGSESTDSASIPSLTAAPSAAEGWLLVPSGNDLLLYDLADLILISSESFFSPLRKVWLDEGGRALVITADEVIPYLVN